MNSPTTSVKDGYYDVLSNNIDVDGIVPVYQNLSPQDETYPYVIISTSNTSDTLCRDDQSSYTVRVNIMIFTGELNGNSSALGEAIEQSIFTLLNVSEPKAIGFHVLNRNTIDNSENINTEVQPIIYDKNIIFESLLIDE